MPSCSSPSATLRMLTSCEAIWPPAWLAARTSRPASSATATAERVAVPRNERRPGTIRSVLLRMRNPSCCWGRAMHRTRGYTRGNGAADSSRVIFFQSRIQTRGSHVGSAPGVQPPVEIGVPELLAPEEAVGLLDRRVVQPAEHEAEHGALAAEVLRVPLQELRRDHDRAFALDARGALDVARGCLLELEVELAALEHPQGGRGARGGVQREVHALVEGDRHVGKARVGTAHRRAQVAVLGQVAAQHAVIDIVQRKPLRQDRQPRALEKRLPVALAGGKAELGGVAQHAGVEDIDPQRRLRAEPHLFRVEGFQPGKAGGKPAVLARAGERGVVASGPGGVEIRAPHRFQRLHELRFHRHYNTASEGLCRSVPRNDLAATTMSSSAPAAPAACSPIAYRAIRKQPSCCSRPAARTTTSGSTSRWATCTPSPTRAPTGATRPNPTSTSPGARSTTRAAACSVAARRSTP